MRRSTTTLTTSLAATLLLFSACSEKAADEATSTSIDAAAEGSADAGAAPNPLPKMGGAVAAGVAFAYNLRFTLPDTSIARVQQDHAAACETLGAARCRVTGMNFEQDRSGPASASTHFLLAPDLARRFASEGITAVEKVDGKLDTASIDGQDADGAIRISQHDSAAIQAELDRLNARLKAKGLAGAERAEIQSRINQLSEQQRGEVALRRDREAAIATTPVNYSYASEGLIEGSGTFSKAASASWGSAQTALGVALLLGGISLPWLVLAGLLVLLWRSRGALRRLLGAAAADPLPPQ